MIVTSSSIKTPPPPHPPNPWAASQNPNNSFLPINRRSLLAALTISTTTTPFAHTFLNPMSAQEVAFARGLFQMPPVRLTNRYFLVRAGESEYESIGVINTNPVAKTSVDNGLSEKGKKQAVRSAFDLKEMGACDKNCWIWPSITQRAYQAAEIIASVNGVSRSYIVPEYSFLDARGLGAYEGKNLEAVSEVYASDTLSPTIKPPPIDDGTPNESVSDVLVRVIQLMSILETQYSEDTVIIVSPDSDNLTVLQAGIIGLDLRRHRELSFAPGEVRFVDTNSVPTYKQPASAVDYTTVFVFRMLMFVDNGLASGMGLDFGWQQRYARFCGRVVVLSILSLLLYPFLWTWTVIGTLWFRKSKDCLPEDGQKWGFLIWLLFSYCALLCVACMSIGKWLTRREAHLLRAQQGIPVSEYGVLVDMIRVPDWAFEAAGQETRGMGQDAAAYQPGLYLTPAQTEAVEALIQELPKFRLKAVPTDCSECPICLEEFHVGNEVRGLPCAHNFHVECIDEWLRLNVKCPRCRCSVFPNLDLSAISNLRPESERSSVSVLTANRYVRTQPYSQSYLLRLQGLLRPVRTENAGVGPSGNGADTALETAEYGGVALSTRDPSSPRPVSSAVHIVVDSTAQQQ
ncbi:E3 ubiquitin-protein ligase SIS3 [Prunus yedoensis var. nudiflora]|uniref:E3 ubiquitin-protein ligase SIS3 n=1 Tax=Prunus yedoensis var. nudiflora TaxID=2094558 RepID=A0A314YDA4_PRUYE|nr:E3 ubiquitin-protein ligase SIS3 [Prunus yedoensis var. nudiflora]